jgi:hypothetical protein
VGVLKGGEGVRVGRSMQGVPCVRRGGEGDDWVGDIKYVLVRPLFFPIVSSALVSLITC